MTFLRVSAALPATAAWRSGKGSGLLWQERVEAVVEGLGNLQRARNQPGLGKTVGQALLQDNDPGIHWHLLHVLPGEHILDQRQARDEVAEQRGFFRIVQRSQEPIKRIAETTGFGNEERMRRSFQRQLGSSPLGYRAQSRRGPATDAMPAAGQTGYRYEEPLSIALNQLAQ